MFKRYVIVNQVFLKTIIFLVTMKTVVLLENHHGSHHTAYLRIFSQALLELGCRVIIFAPKPQEIKTWLSHNCSAYTQFSHVFLMNVEGGTYLQAFRKILPISFNIYERWLYAARIIRKVSAEFGTPPDLVFFNSLDSYFSRYINSHFVDFFFPYKWSGISMQAGFENITPKKLAFTPISKYLNHWEVARSHRCIGIGVLDESSIQELQKRIKKNVVLFPDITEETMPDPNYALVQTIKSRAAGRKIVGLIGSLQKRKGLLTLLEVAKECLDQDFFFVFVGKIESSSFTHEELSCLLYLAQLQPDNCLIHFERIPDEPQFNSLINVSDILFAAYINFPNSSNILTKAAVFEKPVVVSDGFCMGERVEKYNLGAVVPENDVAACIQALYDLARKIDSRLQSEFSFEAYRHINSLQNLRKVLSHLIENDCNCSSF